MDWADTDQLVRLDAAGYTVLEALTPDDLSDDERERLPPNQTASNPKPFICVDGKSYWLKGSVQQGLVCELIIGRLAHMVAAGPMAQIIRVTPGCLPGDGSAAHVEGVVVGSQKLSDVCNARDLAALLGKIGLPERSIESASRARVIAFQTWLGIGDCQVLVDVSSGKVFSIDHGEAFGDVNDLGPPSMVITSIDSKTDGRAEPWDVVETAVSRIERISDNQLLAALAHVPAGDAWRSPVDRRMAIGKWLAARRDQLRGVMQAWATT